MTSMQGLYGKIDKLRGELEKERRVRRAAETYRNTYTGPVRTPTERKRTRRQLFKALDGDV